MAEEGMYYIFKYNNIILLLSKCIIRYTFTKTNLSINFDLKLLDNMIFVIEYGLVEL